MAQMMRKAAKDKAMAAKEAARARSSSAKPPALQGEAGSSGDQPQGRRLMLQAADEAEPPQPDPDLWPGWHEWIHQQEAKAHKLIIDLKQTLMSFQINRTHNLSEAVVLYPNSHQ